MPPKKKVPQPPSPSVDRVLKALRLEKPDRVPRFFSFWSEFGEKWQKAKQGVDIDQAVGNDIKIVAADETAWPSAARQLERTGDTIISRTGWGVTQRARVNAKFSQTLETAVPKRLDPHSLAFDDPLTDSRYEGAGKNAESLRSRFAVFAKTGGPYLRAAFMRGQQDFLMDVAEDPEWTRAFVDRVTDHILTVGVESIRRFTLQQTGIGIYDDICSIHGPVMGPRAFERIFLPSLRKMVKAYKKAGAAFVFLHCDGCVTDLLEMLVEAGIDAVHPLEARCNLHPRVVLERLGGRLRVIGGLDNCRILPRGDRRAVRRHAADLLKTGESGGYILAPHSIGEDISVETIEYLAGVLDRGTGRKQRA